MSDLSGTRIVLRGKSVSGQSNAANSICISTHDVTPDAHDHFLGKVSHLPIMTLLYQGSGTIEMP